MQSRIERRIKKVPFAVGTATPTRQEAFAGNANFALGQPFLLGKIATHANRLCLMLRESPDAIFDALLNILCRSQERRDRSIEA
jgi:hypothetical protein